MTELGQRLIKAAHEGIAIAHGEEPLEINLWKGLKYWNTGEWQTVEEELKLLTESDVVWNPGKKRLFRAMDLCPLEDTRVVILGQDPYPDPKYATGLAFDIGNSEYPPKLPRSLQNILKELKRTHDIDHGGNLEGWAKQGILLWNAIPSCDAFKSMSHDWCEWEPLTQEILEVQSKRNVVFALVGSHGKHFLRFIDKPEKDIICVGHPSPTNRSNPFVGSGFFSKIDLKLKEMGHASIDWGL